MDNYLSIADLCLSTLQGDVDDEAFVNRSTQVARALLRGYVAGGNRELPITSSIHKLYVSARRRHCVLPENCDKLSTLLDKLSKDVAADKLHLMPKQRVFILAACQQLRDSYYIHTTRPFVLFNIKETCADEKAHL